MTPEPSPSPDVQSAPTRSWPARLLIVACLLQFGLVLVQAALAGGALTGHTTALTVHEVLGTVVITSLAVAQVALAAIWACWGRGSWWIVAATTASFGAVTVQGLLGFDDRLTMHLPLGLLVFVAQPALALAVRRRHRPTPRPRRTGTRSTTTLGSALLVAACGPASAVTVVDGPADSPDLVIEAADNVFEPDTTTVPAGPVSVELRNVGEAAHNLVSQDGEVTTGLLDSGQVVSFTIDLDTDLVYRCTVHPGMDGRLSVGS